jgi:electron transfer flavoprotein beta subunit
MNVLVCVKRIPATAGTIALTPDEQEIDTHFLGFTVSPHDECAVEEAVRLVEAHGGETTVLSLGPETAIEQLQAAMAGGVGHAVLLETESEEWDPIATAHAIIDAVVSQDVTGSTFDVLLFGNEAADSGDYQVGVRVAHALDLPCVTGIKALEISDGTAVAKRETEGGWENFEVSLPAVFTVKEGLNLPRYPSVPGRLKAKKAPIERISPELRPGGPVKIRLKLPEEKTAGVEILGEGPAAAPAVVDLLARIGVLPS